MTWTRRRLLRTTATAMPVAVAGCTGPSATTTETPTDEWGVDKTPRTETPKAMEPFDAAKVDYLASVTPIEYKIHDLLLQGRKQRDREPLRWDPELAYVGRVHARDMSQRDYFAHKNPEGQTAGDRAHEYGLVQYNTVWENIAEFTPQQESPAAIAQRLFGLWKDSEPHRKTMFSKGLTHHGTGVYINAENRLFAAMELGINHAVD